MFLPNKFYSGQDLAPRNHIFIFQRTFVKIRIRSKFVKCVGFRTLKDDSLDIYKANENLCKSLAKMQEEGK